MASIQRPASSGSSDGGDPAMMNERKRKRMESNRESARRSRMRKQKLLEDLTDEASRLKIENARLAQSIKAKEEAYAEMEAANDIIRAQTMELSDRLRFLNSIIEIAEDGGSYGGGAGGGVSVEIPQIVDPLFMPWQIPHAMMPMSEMFLHGNEGLFA